MNNNELVTCGVVGTVISATGAGLSVNELQAIISIIVTVLGFIISVLVPLGIKLYNKIKKALEDKKITKEEAEDIMNTVQEIVDETQATLGNAGHTWNCGRDNAVSSDKKEIDKHE